MTNSNSGDRLDQIAALLLETAAINRSNAKAIEANSTAIADLKVSTESTRASVDGLVQTITESSIKTEARLNKLDEAIAGINATNERLERILEQLVRRDRY